MTWGWISRGRIFYYEVKIMENVDVEQINTFKLLKKNNSGGFPVKVNFISGFGSFGFVWVSSLLCKGDLGRRAVSSMPLFPIMACSPVGQSH